MPTGRLTRGREISYALLVFLMLIVGVFLVSISAPAKADTPCKAPNGSSGTAASLSQYSDCSGSITLYAVVPAPVPTRPAVITSPTNGQSFTTNPVTVSGTCQAKTVVQVSTNGILVGSVICSANDAFSVPVDLVVGTNALTALSYNANNQPGPTSPTVTVTLSQAASPLGYSSQMLLQTENYYQGTVTGRSISWVITIVGGEAPYAIDVDWGDGTNQVLTRLGPGPFTISHTYKTPGTGYLNSYPLIIRGTDSADHTAYLQLTTIVNSPLAKTTTASASPTINKLLIIWPIWIVLLLMIISFWLGERREKRIMQRQLEALA